MSERPFMQLYVSDFLGDTLDLSTEGIGAYMLLLMAMWNAGGSLPDDDVKLARITRLTLKRWRAVATDLMEFFGRDNGRITHQRLTKELQKSTSKSELRAAAGSEGGKAKALKDNKTVLANATQLPQHLPDTRSQKEKEPPAQQIVAPAARSKWDVLQSALFEAAGIAGFRDERHPGLMKLGPMNALIEKGYSLETDILPVIRERSRNATFSSWSYFTAAIIEAAAAKAAIPQRAVIPAEGWHARIEAWRHDPGSWIPAWGPKPDERGCRAPAELLRTAA